MSVLHGQTSDRETSVYRKDLGCPLCPVSLHCSALYTGVDCGSTVLQLNGTLTLSCLASDKGALYMPNHCQFSTGAYGGAELSQDHQLHIHKEQI